MHRPHFYTIMQAAEYLNITERFVQRLTTSQRRIPYHKFGRLVRIAESDLATYVNSTRVDGTSEE